MAGPAGDIDANPSLAVHIGGTRPLAAVAGAAVDVGDFVKDNGSGLLIPATAATDTLVGIAASSAAASGDALSIYPWFPGTIIKIQTDDGTNTGTTTLDTTDCWTQFGFGIDSTNGRFFLNLVDTTNKTLVITALVSATGSTRGFCLASPIFNPSNADSVWAL